MNCDKIETYGHLTWRVVWRHILYYNQRIKDLPKDDRPYERCLKYGPEALSDMELLAIIINTGKKGYSACDIATSLLSLSPDGLLGLCKLHVEELMQVEGIGPVKGIKIKCLCEISKRIAQKDSVKKICYNNPETIAKHYGPELRHKDNENLIMLALNTKSALIDEFLVSKGTVNASIASPREIFVDALKVKAVSIILIHNHPSGDPTPSREDKIVTRRIKEAGDIIGISLIDHIIIGDNNYISFKEKEYL
jgi:DNA repair protein RadC